MTAPRLIELVDVDKLVPYELNAKKHPPEQIDKLCKAIEKFGWTQPIVVWKDLSIIAGHGRRLAALQLGLKKVPVIIRDDLSKSEADALRLADNRLSSTEYDQEMIAVELQRLFEEEGDMDLMQAMGFDAKELDFTLADLGEISDDFFVDDVTAAVEAQKSQNAASVKQTDETAAPLADALGFKRCTIAESRELRTLMGAAESRTGLKGARALIEILRGATGA